MRLMTATTIVMALVSATPSYSQNNSRLLSSIFERAAQGIVARKAETLVRAPGVLRIAEADIAGVRLGMAPVQVEAALRAANYGSVRKGSGASFEQLVAEKVAERTPLEQRKPAGAEGAVRQIWATGPAGETLWVRFAPSVSGPQVMFVRVSIDDRRVTKAAFQERVNAKFGRPSAAKPGMLDWFWCDSSVVHCGDDWVSARYPYLLYNAGPGSPSLTLSSENVQMEAIKAAVGLEVDRRAPLQRPSF